MEEILVPVSNPEDTIKNQEIYLQDFCLHVNNDHQRFAPWHSLELEDVFLLLVVQRHLADGVLQADWNLVVVGNSLTGTLLILIETHLLLIDHTVHIVPRPAGTQESELITSTSHPVKTITPPKTAETLLKPPGSYLLEAFLLWPSHSCLRWRMPSSWDVGASCWVLAGRVAAWLALPLRDAPGDPVGLGSDTPLTTSLPSTLSWKKTRGDSQRTMDGSVSHKLTSVQTHRSCESVIRAAACRAEQNQTWHLDQQMLLPGECLSVHQPGGSNYCSGSVCVFRPWFKTFCLHLTVKRLWNNAQRKGHNIQTRKWLWVRRRTEFKHY